MKIFFLLRRLGHGGAERQAVELVKGLHRQGHQTGVVTFYDHGILDEELREAGVRLISIKKRGRWDVLGFLVRLVRLLRKEAPDFLHGYLPIPNILAGFLRPLISGTRIIWGVRASGLDFSHYDWLTWIAYKIEASFSGRADLIIANSYAGRDLAILKGFPEGRTVVIPNGIDTDRFRPDSGARRMVRRELGIGDGTRVIGMVARFDPMKGHDLFLRAAASLTKRGDGVSFICVGDGPEDDMKSLAEAADDLGLKEKVVWLRRRDDLPALYNSFDIFCCPSLFGEGFPNVVGEAMACGVSCVVTDVGDSGRIVGDTGIVVRQPSPEALADALRDMLGRLEHGRADYASRTRGRIVEHFGASRLIQDTVDALGKLP